ncbi:16S rRNA (cytosine(967)-C(5))-methyltransferase RsmB [Methylogaea oryzae]|uniref:16S rRNA (cytosine(967)-C(5))-methyltransferase RsmB n=1 Tax=Methylogaea oryzae TaxID=1295382 RepID=UPI001C7EBB90|nr:16S rRNA (cytosine(967)-C(5))-methyltransferase RsmB [Methylogaea oryzae]
MAERAPNSRLAAARVLTRVVEQGQSLTDALAAELPALPNGRDRAFVQALCFGVMRRYWQLDAILAQLVRKPIQVAEVHMLALAGLYQLSHMAVKPYAAVAETVAAAGRHAWAKPLLNAVLRNYQRRREELEAAIAGDTVATTSHPAWLIERLRGDWPQQWQAILEANNQQPPMVLRANRRRNDRDAYLALLRQQELAAEAAGPGQDAIVLGQPLDVAQLPGFADGLVSVQDGAAQLAAPLLDPQPGDRVLDACAAPGGKTAHLLEYCPQALVTAVDVAPERVQRIGETLQRLNLAATVAVGDAGRPQDWWDGQPFQRILLDAPCSATGVIRRHPDIKWLRRDSDIATLADTQGKLLDALWPLLAPGGVLLYATCSVLREENDRQVGRFLERRNDAVELPLAGAWGTALAYGRQILPGEQGMDGFYYAKLGKRDG